MEGRFLLTHYLFPLEEPIVLSAKLGIVLSNLTDIEELESLYNYIKTSMDGENQHYTGPAHKLRLPLDGPAGILTVKSGLQEFKYRNRNDSYINRFMEESDNVDEWMLLAKMWVVIRYDKPETATLFRAIDNKSLSKFFFPGYENPFFETTINYCHVLSLFIESRSFVQPDLSYRFFYPEPDVMLNSVIFFFSGIHIEGYKPRGDEIDYDFGKVKGMLISWAYCIEEMLDLISAQKLLYIGNLLRIASEKHSDVMIRFTTLVSIIELLLTHNPDFNRFNVEDSISKQFKLKTAVLIHMNDSSIDLELLKNNLQTIYSQRSNISHGNFAEFQKFVQKTSNDESFPMENFYDLTDELYKYVRIVVCHYIKDKKFVEFLKLN